MFAEPNQEFQWGKYQHRESLSDNAGEDVILIKGNQGISL